MIGFGAFALANPWLLLGLGALPLIWLLLRVTPPLPRRQLFPPLRLLLGLPRTEETPAATPWWLTALRLLLAALIVLALAEPILNPGRPIAGSGPLLLVVDDGWASAPTWEQRREAMLDLVRRADRESRTVMLLTTAPPASGEAAKVVRRPGAAELEPLIEALEPKPWPTDRAVAARAVRAMALEAPAHVIWLADGLHAGADELTAALQTVGPVTLLSEGADADLKVLLPPLTAGDGLRVPVRRLDPSVAETVQVRALGDGGRVLGRNTVTLPAGEARAEAALQMPPEVRNSIDRVELEGHASAGAVALLDERWRRRPVGLVSGADLEQRTQPLLSSLYYLERALTPFSEVRSGGIAELLRQPPAVLVLADVGLVPEAQAGALEAWLNQGGVLIRFAGPRLAQNTDELLPARIRSGGRMLGGALSWSEPARLAEFDAGTPFHGLPVPPEVVVRRQVLAEPSLELASRTWARLADGTPLVTAARRERGWTVLFHVTANTDWSNLPLSGLFVEMLRRIVDLSQGVAGGADGGSLPPLYSLDGFGRLGAPLAVASSLDAGRLNETPIDPRHPPGFYGTEQSRRALNLGPQAGDLAPLAPQRLGVTVAGYAKDAEVALKPWLLAAALLLALVDLLAVMALQGLLRARPAAAAAAALLLALTWLPAAPRAQGGDAGGTGGDDSFAIQATLETRLAYVITGDSNVDELSRAGLFGLSDVLRRRTSIEPAEPMGVHIERDELVFFPLLYWPVVPSQPRLSDAALARLDNYMKTGGTVLFDTRDAQSEALGQLFGTPTEATQVLRSMLRRLDIPPLAPVPDGHVLTKAFYLMQSFPGRYERGRLWVEQRSEEVNDGVSSIIIGGNDWAAAWAIDEAGRYMAATVPGGARQREMAYRFGVNLVMYTLTGNYKADQVHVPAILERLGQ